MTILNVLFANNLNASVSIDSEANQGVISVDLGHGNVAKYEYEGSLDFARETLWYVLRGQKITEGESPIFLPFIDFLLEVAYKCDIPDYQLQNIEAKLSVA